MNISAFNNKEFSIYLFIFLVHPLDGSITEYVSVWCLILFHISPSNNQFRIITEHLFDMNSTFPFQATSEKSIS